MEVGLALLWKQGYNDTGIQEVLKQSGVPKGSFYHHFNSKEDFGLQILDRFAGMSVASLDRHLARTEVPAMARLEAFFTEQRNAFVEQGCRDGCMIGNFGQELAATHDVFRQRVELHMAAMIRRLTACLEQAQQEGNLSEDPKDYADVLFSCWHGAVLRMKVQQSIDPVDRFIRIFFTTKH